MPGSFGTNNSQDGCDAFTTSITFAAMAGIVAFSMLVPAFADEAPFSRNLTVRASAISTDLLDTVSIEDVKIKSQSAINIFGQIVLRVNEHFNDFEITEAATIKADGRRIPVAPEKILVSTLPNSSQLLMFEADVKLRTIVFPDVAVGDTVHYATKEHNKVNPGPVGFNLIYIFPPSMRFDNVEISLDVPEDMKIHNSVSGFYEKVSTANGHRQIIWIKEPQAYRADEPGSTSPIDRDPRVIVSSYADQTAIGQKFLEGAAPKSEPTLDIRAIADEITKGIPDGKEQARAIFDWVTKNVRYMAIYLGDGGWVPHDANSILTAKYGDCKDHATLMRALLASKGIAADYALITVRPVYQAFDIPFNYYDHVILYLPEFDLYTDPTATYSSFQYLPDYEADKGVLRAGKNGVLAARTPVLRASTNRLIVKADMTLRADGTPIGTATTEASGPIATTLRQAMSQAALKGGDVFAKEQLSKQNWHGSGNIELPDAATDHKDTYMVKTSFDLTNRFFGNGPNKNAIPIGPRLVSPQYTRPLMFIHEKRTQDFICEAGTYEQTIDIHLPDGQSLARVPQSFDVSAPLATYKSTYTMTGQLLHIERRFESKVPGQVCTAQTAKELSPVVLSASRDFGTHLVFGNEGVESITDDQ
jgi:hypothetical protein